jgi:hypothetical protein
MGLAVLPPEIEDFSPQTVYHDDEGFEDDSDTSMVDDDGRPFKRTRLSAGLGQVTLPGEVITDETQWMR